MVAPWRVVSETTQSSVLAKSGRNGIGKSTTCQISNFGFVLMLAGRETGVRVARVAECEIQTRLGV